MSRSSRQPPRLPPQRPCSHIRHRRCRETSFLLWDYRGVEMEQAVRDDDRCRCHWCPFSSDEYYESYLWLLKAVIVKGSGSAASLFEHSSPSLKYAAAAAAAAEGMREV